MITTEQLEIIINKLIHFGTIKEISSEVVEENSNLTLVNINSYNLSKQDIGLVCDTLRKKNSILSLDLSNCKMCEDNFVGFGLLCQILSENNKIKILDLSKNSIDNKKVIYNFLEQKNTPTSLHILCNLISKNSTIETLFINDSKIGNDEDGAKLFLTSLCTNKSLLILWANNCEFHDNMISSFCHVLRKNVIIREVYMYGNYFTHHGIEELKSKVGDLYKIMEIKKSKNDIDINNNGPLFYTIDVSLMRKKK